MPSARDIDFLGAVEDMQSKGFAGMFTGRLYRRRDARRLENDGLLESKVLEVADGDGFIREGCKPREGYLLTPKGREALATNRPGKAV
jgi:hypothetical protein